MKKIKWGVIGCGGIADRRTIPGLVLADNAELVAVMDINMELAKKVGEKYNVSAVYDNIDDLLSNDEVEVVYIATPVFLHKEQSIAALKAGKHVLVEKPVGLTVAEGNEIAELAKSKNLKVSVGLMMRYHTYHQQIKELISSGKIGDIVSMRAQFTCWFPESDKAWSQSKKMSGGGSLMDLGVHCIDLLLYLSSLKACIVSGMCETMTFSYEVEDSASVLIKMENGAKAYVDVNFNIPDDASESRLEFFGTRGSIIANGTMAQEEVGTVKVTESNQEGYDAMQERTELNSYILEGDLGNMYTKEIEAFSDALLNNKTPVINIDEAIFVQKIIEAAYESSASGKFINL